MKEENIFSIFLSTSAFILVNEESNKIVINVL